MKDMLEGKEKPGRFGTVDVRDIAKAHVAAIEKYVYLLQIKLMDLFTQLKKP